MPTRDADESWFDERLRLEKKWSAWRSRVRTRGIALTVSIPLDRTWAGIEKEFSICFADARGGSHDVRIQSLLAKETPPSLARRIREALPDLPIGTCAQCGAKALLRNANLETSLLGEEPVEMLSCERCVQRTLANAGKADEAMHREKLRAGFAWFASAVFRRKSDEREYFYRDWFRSRPSAATVRSAAKRHACSVVAGTTVIGPTKSYFSP